MSFTGSMPLKLHWREAMTLKLSSFHPLPRNTGAALALSVQYTVRIYGNLYIYMYRRCLTPNRIPPLLLETFGLLGSIRLFLRLWWYHLSHLIKLVAPLLDSLQPVHKVVRNMILMRLHFMYKSLGLVMLPPQRRQKG